MDGGIMENTVDKAFMEKQIEMRGITTGLIDNVALALGMRNAPFDLSSKIINELRGYPINNRFIGGRRLFEGELTIGDGDDLYFLENDEEIENKNKRYKSEYTYSIVLETGVNISLRLSEKRTEKKTGEVSFYHCMINVLHENGEYLVEKTSGYEQNDPDNISSRKVYINPKELDESPALHEFCSKETEDPCSSKEVLFLNELGKLVLPTPMFKKSIDESLAYQQSNQQEYYFVFYFGKTKNILEYDYTIATDIYRVKISGTMDNADVKVLSIPNKYKEVPYNEFIESCDNDKASQKVIDIVEKLKELEVAVQFSKLTSDEKSSNGTTR